MNAQPRSLVEDWIPASAIDDLGGEDGLRVSSEVELGINVLLVVDTYVLNVSGLVDEDFEGADESIGTIYNLLGVHSELGD